MKRLVSFALAVAMLLCMVVASASAGTFSASNLAKSKASNSATETKTTGNGVSAKGTTTSMTANATFFFRVWKYTAWQASNGATVSGNKSFTMTTLKDGNDQPRLWKGTSYYIAATHSKSSKVETASCGGTWNP